MSTKPASAASRSNTTPAPEPEVEPKLKWADIDKPAQSLVTAPDSVRYLPSLEQLIRETIPNSDQAKAIVLRVTESRLPAEQSQARQRIRALCLLAM